MFCWKKAKGNYSPTKPNNNNNQQISLTNTTNNYISTRNTLQSVRKKKPSNDRKDSNLSIRFKSNLK